MNTIALYDRVCLKASRHTTRSYSTSFSLGIRSLHKRFHDPIYAIYGFVRFADEIVDTFHDHDKVDLMARFRADTYKAIADGISLNPILHSFQRVVNTYGIEEELYDTFLRSMEMDLTDHAHDRESYELYILGSAEVVGLMCLRVFCEGDDALYQRLKPSAMRLGAAFQKVNFLRDLKDDHVNLGRTYFPGVDVRNMSAEDKRRIEGEIDDDFRAALEGIRQLPQGARFGVYMAYIYYMNLFRKIQALPTERILQERVRVRNRRKIALLTTSYLKHSFGLL
ncbi:MAG TPA: phytoene/squalene synthase family protein [Flavobacteriales bacterium]|nr:phytoene/squalene synthase family protein [Flavobacteriales bacterium]MCB9199095.1 phytoene/squalene synthase family protein [Flavobacteriales bacterium]HOP44105.1 phytoene/squalene synthase family protein [Flavobacteriales bacterium]HPF66291.1 phytoene/squalene synthase family protein [Flavobacteriales bacterium]HPJ52488.1 phytoene/squalene synthase family protein [Flavobacteriales bacterium]